ncbi:hypothetical protein KHC28_24425 [Ancylobacter sonchi]|uniref:hypothetical protein n=1 Tax=Ancylobacter sonchi TaxID=1937790 RepID=UPI001BD3672C|nr:hypothetical protein [Ancylobacter sonchi]MBS7536793.1 hypothetical protein [Ancylobacter sonchi]
MTDWPKDEWGEAGARDFLEALGVLSLRYDRLQLALIRLIERYLAAIPEKILNQLLFPLNNNQRIEILYQIASEMETKKEIKELLIHFQKGFSICTENRNIAMHANGHLGSTHFHFTSIRKKFPFDYKIYSISLKEFRGICDSILEMTDFAWRVNRYIALTMSKSTHIRVGALEAEMPIKPPLPRKLILPKEGKWHPDAPIFF